MRRHRTAPASLHSIAFAYAGARHAILLRDHCRDRYGEQPLVGTPEWTAAGFRAPAAYVCRAQPTIQVQLSRPRKRGPLGGRVTDDPSPTCTVYAYGAGGPGIAPRKIRLRFDKQGLTAPIAFRLSKRFRKTSGRLHLRWTWSVQVASEEFALGTSSHEIYLTAHRIRDPAEWLGARTAMRIGGDARGTRWTYSRIMEWTCQWAAGKDDKKAIVDAIMKNLPSSGLKYAIPEADVTTMLVRRGAYCGVWAQMFQAMAASQGVPLERHGFAPHGKLWDALVICRGGINRVEPRPRARTFRDAGETLDGHTAVVQVTQKRYSFGARQDGSRDCHVFNVLKYRGSQYVYDPCFLMGPIRLDRPLPKPGFFCVKDVARLGNFHRAYLSMAVDFMRGSLPWGSHGHTTRGLTIPTALLNTPGTLIFLWI